MGVLVGDLKPHEMKSPLPNLSIEVGAVAEQGFDPMGSADE